MKYFDIILIVLGFITGLISLIAPKKAWHLLQSKKMKAIHEYTEKDHKQMIIGGVIILALTIAFLLTIILV